MAYVRGHAEDYNRWITVVWISLADFFCQHWYWIRVVSSTYWPTWGRLGMWGWNNRDDNDIIILRWGREGAEGWNYETCLPYFRKAQTHQLGEDEYRSVSQDKIYHKTWRFLSSSSMIHHHYIYITFSTNLRYNSWYFRSALQPGPYHPWPFFASNFYPILFHIL